MSMHEYEGEVCRTMTEVLKRRGVHREVPKCGHCGSEEVEKNTVLVCGNDGRKRRRRYGNLLWVEQSVQWSEGALRMVVCIRRVFMAGRYP
ncbi:MAG: hypothetical protein DRP97_02145 [Candidatus Latescibacterota bacterium]|nr:MAG: hypothetical protein DRP97_02145 [Candidatus Latescibacterota bacterium]